MSGQEEEFDQLLRPVLAEIDCPLSAEQIALLSVHYCLLQAWNRRVNLTSIRRPEDMVRHHFGESLFVAQLIRDDQGSLVDVGSGAGFPGGPIAVAKPNLRVVAVESVAKKAAFLKELSRSIRNLSVVHDRFENVQMQFEWATMRAVEAVALLGRLVWAAERFALVTTERKAEEIERAERVVWERTERVPWSRQRIVLLGRRGRST